MGGVCLLTWRRTSNPDFTSWSASCVIQHCWLLQSDCHLITYCTLLQYANCVLGQENHWQYGKSSHLESNHMGAWSKNVYVSQSGSNLQIPHSKIDYPQCHSLMPWPCPLADKEKGLVTIEWFLGCVNSAVLILYKRWLHACMTYNYFTGDSAQPRNRTSHQTLFLMRGWGLGVRLTTPWQERPDMLVCDD